MACWEYLVVVLTLFLPGAAPELFSVHESRVLLGARPPPASPWPLPRTWQQSSSLLTFRPAELSFKSDTDCSLITGAFTRLTTGLLQVDSANSSHGQTSHPLVVRILLQDRACATYPRLGVRENYTIEVTGDVQIQGATVWGVLWGLETLAQLMYMVNGQWYINRTWIQDEPRFSHRGLHLDTARHFYPIDMLKRNLNVMATNKFNVFHWHLVDSQAFPYRSIKFPQLADNGAYTPRQTYTQQDVREIIEHARVRGIRVIPEFDSPGHVYSWSKGIPELLTPCWSQGRPFQAVPNSHADRENMDPSKNFTFQFMAEFFQEVKDLFVDDYLHLGMDEASYSCWRSNPDIADFMRKSGIGANNFTGLEQYYDEKILNILQSLGRKTIIWEDPLNNGAKITKNTLVQLWKDTSLGVEFKPWPTYMKPALAAGYDVILSSCWYLNYIHYGQDWKNLYSCEPTNIDATREELSHIHGGEACTWSEYIDENNLLQVVWPRAAAVAERLWSPAHVNNTDDAALRLDQHRCRMVRHGVPAPPILPGYCRDDYNTDNSGVHALPSNVPGGPTTPVTPQNPTPIVG